MRPPRSPRQTLLLGFVLACSGFVLACSSAPAPATREPAPVGSTTATPARSASAAEPPAGGSASAHSDVPVAPPPPPPGPAKPAASLAADTPFAATALSGSFLGGAFEGKHAIGYPSADKTFTVAVWDVPVTCAARRPQGRFVKIVFPRREKAPRQKLGMNGILVGDEGPSAREAGISQGVFAELATTPKGAKQGEARLVADFDAPEFKVSVKLNGTTTFAVCKCTEKDCL